MKKIVLLVCFIATSVAMLSCTSEELEKKGNSIPQKNLQSTSGGQNGQTPVPVPK
jgi:hypothetical protein